VIDGGANILKRYTCIEEALNYFKNENVTETIESCCSRTMSGSNRWLDKTCPSPIIELTIGNSSSRTCSCAAITNLKILFCHERGLAFE
jgi:hypothetical protein